MFKAHGTCGQLLLADFWVLECYNPPKSAAKIRTTKLVTSSFALDAQQAVTVQLEPRRGTGY